jgi:hypothetical protein
MVLPVLSQRSYPGVGDIDDCWVVATVWAAASSRPTIAYPTTTTFRRFAGVPDLPGPTGGNIDACNRGADACWPTLSNILVKSSNFATIQTLINEGRPASVSLNSAYLPARLRYNFYGLHQVGIHRPSRYGAIYCMNPLAPGGTTPRTISWDELQLAMVKLVDSDTPYRALFFPRPVTGPLWGWDVDEDIRATYSAATVAKKLKEVGVATWGQRINEVDLEAGLRARGMTYGTSVQLIDVRKLMRPGTGR